MLEMETKKRETVSYESSSGLGGATVAGVIVQLPGVLLVIEVRLSIVSTYR